MLFRNGLITFFISGNPVFSNGPTNLPWNPPDWIILNYWVFHNLISTDEWFAKALWIFKTCLSFNNNLWGKFVSSLESPITFDVNLKTTSVSFFIADFNLLSYEFDSFTFKLLYCVILYIVNQLIKIKIYKTFTVPYENSKTVSFASSRMK